VIEFTKMMTTKTTEEVKNSVISQIIPFGITGLFLCICMTVFPFLVTELPRISLYLSVVALFYFGIESLSHLICTKCFTSLPADKTLECENRLTYMIFNFSVGLPSYLAWYNLLSFLPSQAELVGGRTLYTDYFAVYSIAYIMYDYSTLGRIYGTGSTLIQLHHCAEALIVCSYASYPVAAGYIIGGGLMQFSSGILHIQRILQINGLSIPPVFDSLLKIVLRLAWGHGRLIAFPMMMWNNFWNFPMDVLHIFLLIAGTSLTIMNSLWFIKIWKMKNLSF